MRVETIIFDLGGVILDIDYQRTVRAFQDLGFANFHEEYGKMKQSGLFDDLETGRIAEAQFVDAIRSVIPHASHEEVLKAWNAIILDFPLGRLDYVRTMSSQFNTALLSNTNAIHVEYFNQKLQRETGVTHIGSFFGKAYLSHEIGLRKPNREVFEYVLSDLGKSASQCLFIDDSPQHVATAREMGIHTIHLEHIIDLPQALNAFLA